MSNVTWKYTPFLKLKQNEIMAIRELHPDTKNKVIPFFDFPKGNDESKADFQKFSASRSKQIKKHLGSDFICYLDTFDSNEFNEPGFRSYQFLLESFSEINVIAVTGLNRSEDHKQSIIEAASKAQISTESLAFRVLYEDITSFNAIKSEIDEALHNLSDKFESIDLVIDLRVCNSLPDFSTASTYINKFVSDFSAYIPTRNVIITGSSISENISDICAASSNRSLERKEIHIYTNVRDSYKAPPQLIFGDYTVVSPNFSEVDLSPELMRSVMTSKLIYSHAHVHHIWRGTTLKLEGEKQYNEHIRALTKTSFYRKNGYSWGDSQFHEKKDDSSGFNASSMIKHVVNAHIEFMVKTPI